MATVIIYWPAERGATSPIGPPCPGGGRCDCRMGHQDCSAFRPSAEPSQQLCGNLCSATAVQHGQLSGRIFSIRHVRSNSGERVSVGPSVSSLGLNVVAWPVRRHVPPSIFDGGGESMCSAPKAVSRVRFCLGGGTNCLPYYPLNIRRVMMAPTRKSRN